MAAVCPSTIHLCFIRVTRVDSLGEPVAGPNNFYVGGSGDGDVSGANPMVLTITPDILAGEVKDLKGGCDQLIATYRGQDILKRFNLELDVGNVSPALEEIMTGADAITDSGADPIGVQFNVPCGFQQPFVAFEAWQDLWDCDHQPSTPYPYRRWVFPSSRWQRGAETAQNDFDQPKFTGFTVANGNWGDGIYADTPVAIGPNGAWFFDTELPEADCTWQSHSVS